MTSNLVDNEAGVARLMDFLASCTSPSKLIFIDTKGATMGDGGDVLVMCLLVPSSPRVNLIDFHVLKDKALDTKSSTGSSLRDVLQSERYSKVFFDVRDAANVLFERFQVQLRNVWDLQVFQLAANSTPGGAVKTFFECIAESSVIEASEKRRADKMRREETSAAEVTPGDNPDELCRRPIAERLIETFIAPVSLYPKLLLEYGSKLSIDNAKGAFLESARRAAAISKPSDLAVWAQVNPPPLHEFTRLVLELQCKGGC
jgi:hypothetical protein